MNFRRCIAFRTRHYFRYHIRENPMKKQVVLAGIALAAVSAAGHAAPIVASQVPTRADAPVLFAPRGWKIEQQINGHLNGDKVWDAALVLVENPIANNADANAAEAPRDR